ncbi:MAG: 5-formyltetrahydrofolate cyclo-ligase [Campylobacterales bacterium]|nr:5-formyltetrahydrofolate cyclo-ligase [Campylobacterales bacterium]
MSIDKASFRKVCMKRLKDASLRAKKSKEHKLISVLEEILHEVGAKSVLFYLPLSFEVDLRSLLKKARRKSIKCYVPFMVSESFKMVTYRGPLKLGNFGVSEPNNSLLTIKNIDVAIVPVVGVDTDAKRIGFGKGMYDRFFSNLAEKPLTIFVQLDECICNTKITDHYDVQADIYLTPKSIKYRNKNVKSDSLRRWDRYRQRSSRIFDLQKIKQRAI